MGEYNIEVVLNNIMEKIILKENYWPNYNFKGIVMSEYVSDEDDHVKDDVDPVASWQLQYVGMCHGKGPVSRGIVTINILHMVSLSTYFTPCQPSSAYHSSIAKVIQ